MLRDGGTPAGARIVVELRRPLGIGSGQRRMWFSSSYHALLGYRGRRAADVGSTDFDRNIHPEDLPPLARDMRDAHRATARRSTATLRMRMKNGEYRWFRHRGTGRAQCAGHAPSRCPARSRTSTNRSSPRTRCDSAQQRFERAINGTQDGLWELEADGTAWCSPRVAELLGYAPGRVRQQHEFPQAIPASRRCRRLSQRRRRRTSSRSMPYDVEIRLRTQSGEYRWYRARATAERDAERPPVASVRLAAGRDRCARRTRRAAARHRSGRSRQPAPRANSSPTSATRSARR